jgi:DNA-binding CsgD family transcriptional regulator
MQELQKLQMEYGALLASLEFPEEDFTNGLPEEYRVMLEQMSQIKNCGISVFDMKERRHAFASYSFESVFGYDSIQIKEHDSAYFDSRIHPEDMAELLRRGIHTMRFYLDLPQEERLPYKLINEYRIRGKDDAYLRVVEQHQPLLQDSWGNIRFTLSVLDISPHQQADAPIATTLMRVSDGALFPYTGEGFSQLLSPPSPLTSREAEVLSLIRDGLASKQIAHSLAISVHTVNTHRQRILEKLNASNSAEAVALAARLRLLS